MKWVVLRYVPSRQHLTASGRLRGGSWEEISSSGDYWEAPDAGEAFSRAVLNNKDERIESTSYMVLPFEGSVTFNVDVNVNVNVDAKKH